MNDFTKEELSFLLESICIREGEVQDIEKHLEIKIQSMIDKYCEPVCPECFDKECFKSHKCLRKLNDNQ